MKKLLILMILTVFLIGCAQKEVTNIPVPGNEDVNEKVVEDSKDVYSVNMQNNAFGPAILEIETGESVKWTNNDASIHSVSFTDEIILDDLLKTGESAKATFDKAGTFNYKCKIHPSMTGSIVVK